MAHAKIDRHSYGQGFFEYISEGSRRSARKVVGIVTKLVPVRSLLDVGCGQGAWCAEWLAAGIPEVLGIDGEYVDRDAMLIPTANFRAQDLSRSFDLGRRFDLVVSLEVAEHIPEEAARTFVENLARHGDVILFSAAVPGQGGEFHVNERPYGYWRAIFAEQGFRCLDAIRPRILKDASVEPWYRYNTLLFVRDGAMERVAEAARDAELPATADVPDLSPPLWRLRNAVLRSLPRPVIEVLAHIKHAWYTRVRAPRPAKGGGT